MCQSARRLRTQQTILALKEPSCRGQMGGWDSLGICGLARAPGRPCRPHSRLMLDTGSLGGLKAGKVRQVD